SGSADPELAGRALTQWVRKDGAPAFDGVFSRLDKTEDAEERGRIIGALAGTLDPALAQRALALSLAPGLRKDERSIPVLVELGQRETREAAWQWLQAHFDELAALIPEWHTASMVFAATYFCDPAHLAQAETFFQPRVAKIPSAPRNLKIALEAV